MTRLTSDLTDALVFAMLVLGILFVARYTWIAPWWRYRVGKAMVSLDIANIILLIPSALALAFHIRTGTFIAWYRVTGLVIGAGIIAWRTWTIDHINSHTNNSVEPAPVEKTPMEEPNDAVRSE